MSLLIVAITVLCTIAIQQIYKSAIKRRLRNIEQTKAKRAKYIESLKEEIQLESGKEVQRQKKKKKKETEGIDIGNTMPVQENHTYKAMYRYLESFCLITVISISDISIRYKVDDYSEDEYTHRKFNQKYKLIKPTKNN